MAACATSDRIRRPSSQARWITYSGDLKVFADAEQIAIIERQMRERGDLDSRNGEVVQPHAIERLIWPCDQQLLQGQEPMAFDLLYGTRTRPASGGQPLVLSAQLHWRTTSRRADGDRRPKARFGKIKVRSTISPPAEPHRAGEVGPARLEFFGGPVKCAGGLRQIAGSSSAAKKK